MVHFLCFPAPNSLLLHSAFVPLHLSFSSSPIICATTNSLGPAKAPKKSKFLPTTFFGPTKMTLAMLGEMENQGVLTPSLGRVPPETDTYAKPREDEVV